MKIFIAIGLVATLAAGYFVISDRARMVKRLEKVEKQAAEVTDREPVAALPIPVQISQPILQLPPEINASAAPVASAETQPIPDPPSEDAADPDAFKARASAELDEFFDHLAKTSTTRTVQSDLQEAFGKLQLPQAPIPALDCRGSVCRAEFSKMDDALAHELLMKMTKIGWGGPMTAFITDGPQGAKSVRVFAASSGTPMPLPHG